MNKDADLALYASWSTNDMRWLPPISIFKRLNDMHLILTVYMCYCYSCVVDKMVLTSVVPPSPCQRKHPRALCKQEWVMLPPCLLDEMIAGR